MKKLTPEQFAAMNCKALRQWVQDHCVQRPKGRPVTGTALTPYERLKRHRQKQKLQS